MHQLHFQGTPLLDIAHREDDASHAGIVEKVARDHIEQHVPTIRPP
jgi:hypothetical protein